MEEEVKECNLNNISFFEKSNMKEEFKDNSCCIDIFETSISANDTDTELKDNVWDDKIKEYKIASNVHDMKIELSTSEGCNIEINDNVQIENKIDPNHIKIEFDTKLSFCEHCNEHYEDYCTRCGMLACILNGIILTIIDGRAVREIPNLILEIRESSGGVGVFALKVIPECVKIGPFNGLGTSQCPRRLKGGKFIVPEDKSQLLNWMQYIIPARNIFQQNLIPFQHEDKLYYHSNREILAGEELRVYFGEEYEDSVNKDIEMDFIAPAEVDVKDVFACAPCCLGFSSRGYLAKHKSTCPSETRVEFSFDELTQCPICNIYVYEKEYLKCHMPYCCETNSRKCISLALDNHAVEVNRRKIRLQVYKCTQCKYKTSYRSVLRRHLNEHCEVKMYRCEICSRQFKTKGSLELHVKYIHIDVDGKVGQRCSMRDHMKTNTKARNSKVYRYLQVKQHSKRKFQTKYKYYLEAHVKTKQLKEFSYKCKKCYYKTNRKQHLEVHINSKHRKQFSYKCEICDYKTNTKSNLKVHTRSKHLKQFDYECEKCDYKINHKTNLEIHVKSKHLEEFSHVCEICAYKTNHKQNLERHIRTKHLKEFSYDCELCDYKTNEKLNFDVHVKSIHLKEFSYKCGKCDYKTNHQQHFDVHVKSKHLKQFSYKCKKCAYKTNARQKFDVHVKSKHLKEFNYECNICNYKTNTKSNLKVHTRSKHLKQFNYECEICDYKTNNKQDLQKHIKSKHLKEFSYECDICDYKTNNKQNLERHIRTKHLKELSYECETCDYKTNCKQDLPKHVKSKHLKEFSYECEICDYKTNNKQNFERHIRIKHLKELSYECDICDYKTNQKQNLERHMRTKHLKEFSYECEICDYKTNIKTNLKVHTKSKHLKQFNYECETCDYKTNSKSRLENHMKRRHLK